MRRTTTRTGRADAAWGALTNSYGLLSSYGSIEELDPSEGLSS